MKGHLSLRVCLVALVLFLAGTMPVLSQGPSSQLVIVNTVANLSEGSLTITGVNFGASAPWVTVDGVPVPIVSASDTQIIVMLPGWVTSAPATYLLTVYRGQPAGGTSALAAGPGDKKFAAAFFTIGVVGPQGEKGEKGEKGDRGEDGAEGAPGGKGETGAVGDKGDKGDKGEAGDKGDTGSKGEPGPTGAVGPRGEQGIQGETGAQGPKGDSGAQGPQGATGPQGPQGASGPQGAQGPTGPQGSTGPQGPTGPQGAAAPASGIVTGVDGSSNGGRLQLSADVPGPLSNVLGVAGEFAPQHHVLVVENQRGTTSNAVTTHHNTGGLAVILNSHSPDVVPGPANRINMNDNYVTFFARDGNHSDKIVGRIEGVSPTDVASVFTDLASFGLGTADLFTLDIELNPVQDWLRFTAPSMSGGSTGSLLHPGFVAPSFTAGGITGWNRGSIDFTPGGVGSWSRGSISWDPGALPSIHWPGIDFANWYFDPGRAPSLSFTPPDFNFTAPSLTFHAPDFTFTPPSVNWGSMGQSLMGLQYSAPTFPTLTPGGINQINSPFKKFDLGFDLDKGADLPVQFAETFGGAASFAWDAKSDPVGFAMKYGQTTFTAGVTYESGSGDYAEWLERLNPEEAMAVTDVVGVHGGKISKVTDGASQVMVISFKPIVLGNMPDEGRKELFEKVAFLGQTLVKVRGVFRKGDLIVPSGFEDGTAVAIPAQRLPIDQWERVVGVAWADGGLRTGGVSLANIAVGISASQMARVMRAEWQRSDARISELEQELLGLKALKAELLALVSEVQARARR
jgi:hypothetical protein